MIKSVFQRISPGINTAQLNVGWFAINHSFIKDKRSRRDSYSKLYRLKSKHGSIFRHIRFSPNLKGEKIDKENNIIQNPQLLIDWSGWMKLTNIENEKDNIEIEMSKANFFQIFYYSDTHPDPAYRHSMLISRIGLYLGIISLILAFK